MSTELTNAFKQALFPSQTDEVFLFLVELRHPSLATPLRFVNNAVDVVSNGNTYIACPFKISLPSERSDQTITVDLQIDNVDRQIVGELRSIEGPIDVDLSLVLESNPDEVEIGPLPFVLRGATYSAMIIQGTLAYEDHLDLEFPRDLMDSKNCPGIFRVTEWVLI